MYDAIRTVKEIRANNGGGLGKDKDDAGTRGPRPEQARLETYQRISLRGKILI
jgi:hypothetical protein